MNSENNPSVVAHETDQALQELTGGTFDGLSQEDRDTLAQWGEEARTAHLEARAAGHAALQETVGGSNNTPESGAGSQQLVTVGANMIVAKEALDRYQREGQDMTAGTYSNGQR